MPNIPDANQYRRNNPNIRHSTGPDGQGRQDEPRLEPRHGEESSSGFGLLLAAGLALLASAIFSNH